MYPNQRSYANIMIPRSWLLNLPPWGRKLYDGSSYRVTFWTFGVLTFIIIINRPIWPHFVFSLAWMSIAATSLLIDSYHHFSNCITVCSISTIEYVFTVSLLSLQNVYYYDSVYFLSFRSRINPDQFLTQGGDGHNKLSQQLGKVRVEKIERINFIHA